MREVETFVPGQSRERLVTDYLTVEPFLPGAFNAACVENKLGYPFKATVLVEDGWLRITLEPA